MNETDDAALRYDILIIGGGPAGLSAAIHVKQLAPELSVCLLEKGAAIGAHQLSGAIMPDDYLAPLQALGHFFSPPPAATVVTDSQWYWYGAHRQFRLPDWILPPVFRRKQKQSLIQLSSLCQWLGEEAMQLGVDLFTAQAAAHALYDDNGVVCGVMTGDMGCNEDGTPGPQYMPGIAIHAAYTLLAEGAKGSLSREIAEKFHSHAGKPQHYALGFKERWHLSQGGLKAGQVIHSMGWPLNRHAGGGFLYAFSEHELAVGLILQLDYREPDLDPFALFQQFKAHPAIATLLQDAECQGFGARTLNEGGWQALGQLAFPGGAYVGCAAGLLDLLKQQGIPHAIQSGVLAAKACVNARGRGESGTVLHEYDLAVKQGPIGQALREASPIKPALANLGGIVGSFWLAAHYWLKTAGGCLPQFGVKLADHENLLTVSSSVKAVFAAETARDQALYLARIKHPETQPLHLQISDKPISPQELEYSRRVLSHCCPGKVYAEDDAVFAIRANRCLHCKCCEIKDPAQQIHWTPPDGGSGPSYLGL